MDFPIQADGFLEIPHSADLALQVWAASLPGLFIQAAKGMYSLMRIDNFVGNEMSRKMDIQEIDLENLLISFLSELLVDIQQYEKKYDHWHLEINHFSLKGYMMGKKNCSFGREIKAVTYHNFKIIKIKSGYKTTIVFDI